MPTDAAISDHLSRDFPPDATRPLSLDLDRQKHLLIKWADGVTSIYPLVFLRAKCPCATCRTPAPPQPQVGTSLTILPANFNQKAVASSAALVGNYAIQLRWADGHDTGIYDFRYLRAIDPSGSEKSAAST